MAVADPVYADHWSGLKASFVEQNAVFEGTTGLPKTFVRSNRTRQRSSPLSATKAGSVNSDWESCLQELSFRHSLPGEVPQTAARHWEERICEVLGPTNSHFDSIASRL